MAQQYVEHITDPAENFDAWYVDVVQQAELADDAPVRGMKVVRPYGYGIWELIQRAMDDRFKQTGVENAYFPLLIPQSMFDREAEHVEGFTPEVAWVTRGGTKDRSGYGNTANRTRLHLTPSEQDGSVIAVVSP